MDLDVEGCAASLTGDSPLSDARLPTAAGFSVREDHVDVKLDLHTFLVPRPAATYFLRVRGDSLKEAGIGNQDLLVVDRSLTPVDGKFVIAVVNDELVVTTFRETGDKRFLKPTNKCNAPIELKEDNDTVVWGVVRHVIRWM
jgi:DNA polymerase V